jgi:HEPN domain-containing protein
MKNSKIFQEWLEKAEENYGFAVESIQDTKYYAQVCFHFHQAAEKYLKTFIIAHNLEFRAVHNLLELLRICEKKAPGVSNIEEACYYLNPFYIDTRYPVHWPTRYGKVTAVRAMDAARTIRAWTLASLTKPSE